MRSGALHQGQGAVRFGDEDEVEHDGNGGHHQAKEGVVKGDGDTLGQNRLAGCGAFLAGALAVAAFLEGRLGWLGIAEVVEDTLDSCDDGPMDSVGDVLEADRLARERASTAVERRLAAA